MADNEFEFKGESSDITIRKSDIYNNIHGSPDAGQEQKKKHHQPPAQNETKHHFKELAKETEIYNQKLIASNSPFRFCIYRKGEEIFIDFVVLDDARAKIKKLVQQNITHQDFKQWISHIERGEGLLFDGLG